jgi:hypothetical protein
MRSFYLVFISILFLNIQSKAQINDSIVLHLSKTNTYLQFEFDEQNIIPKYWAIRSNKGQININRKLYQEFNILYQRSNRDTVMEERLFEHISDEIIEWKTDKDGYILRLPLNNETDTFGIIDGVQGGITSKPLFDAKERNMHPDKVPMLFRMKHDTTVYVVYRKEFKKVELIFSPYRMLKLMIGDGFSELSNRENVIDSFYPKFMMNKGESVELTFKQPKLDAENKIVFEEQLMLRATYKKDTIIDNKTTKLISSQRFSFGQNVMVALNDMLILESDTGYLIDGARFVHKFKAGTDYKIVDPVTKPYYNYYDMSSSQGDPFAMLNIAIQRKIYGGELVYQTQWRSDQEYQITYVNGFPLPFYENAAFQGSITYIEMNNKKYGYPFVEPEVANPGQIRYLNATSQKLKLEIELKSKAKVTMIISDKNSNEKVEVYKEVEFEKGRKFYDLDIPMLMAENQYKIEFKAVSGKKIHEQLIDFMPH